MTRALALAERACGDTSPNPMVGAVIVNGGRIVGEGYHRRAGLPHAEIEALRRAGSRARGATIYVNLEPCAHHGRTPPCTDAVSAAGVRRVVAAMRDPNPRVSGRGAARLRRAGVRVDVGCLRAQAMRLNAPFVTAMTARRPWVVVKLAQSLDGKIALTGGESRWISGKPARRLVHGWRRRVDAVMVGVGTVLQDDPALTVRLAKRPPRPGKPIRVIVDSRLRTPRESRCLSGRTPTILATTARSASARQTFERRGVTVLRLLPRRGRVPLRRLFAELTRRFGVQSVLIEGGGELAAGALHERLVDRVLWVVAPMIIGGRTAPPSVGGAGVRRLSEAVRLANVITSRVGQDVVIEADVVYP